MQHSTPHASWIDYYYSVEAWTKGRKLLHHHSWDKDTDDAINLMFTVFEIYSRFIRSKYITYWWQARLIKNAYTRLSLAIRRLVSDQNQRGGERRWKRKRYTVFLERTREGHRHSDEHWNRFKGNVGESSERRGGEHMDFSERIYTILSWTELNWTQNQMKIEHVVYLHDVAVCLFL